MATDIDPKTLFSTPNHCVTSFSLWNIRYITKKMQDEKLFKDYTMQEVLDELDVIGCFEMPKKRLEVGEVTTRQKELYAKLGVEPPSSLQ